MQMDCREIQRAMWTDGPEAVPDHHLTGCAACRGEARRAADLLAALAGMRTRVAIAPAELEQTILAAATRARPNRAREIVAHPKFWRGAAVGAAAAATAAVGVIVARRHAATRPQVA